ncbi:LPS export ABC transporter periplasmic protein LptC [Candidatus Dependentiae bacterium]
MKPIFFKTSLYIIIAFTLFLHIKNYFFGPKYKIKKIKSTTTIKSKTINPTLKIKNFCLNETLKNKNNIKIQAEKANFFHQTNEIVCDNTHCQYFIGKKKIAKLTTNKALINQNEKIIYWPQEVIGNFYELKFEGKNVIYNHANQKITTSEETNYHYPNLHFVAQKSIFDLNKNEIKMKNGIRCEIKQN